MQGKSIRPRVGNYRSLSKESRNTNGEGNMSQPNIGSLSSMAGGPQTLGLIREQP